jgi:hypothetical protein
MAGGVRPYVRQIDVGRTPAKLVDFSPEGEGMIKVVAFLRRNPALSPEEFRDYWTNVHVPMIKSRLPHLVKYTGSFPAPGFDGDRSTPRADVDAIVELGFPDRATMEADMSSPLFLSADRQESSAHLMLMDELRSIVMEEVDVPVGR